MENVSSRTRRIVISAALSALVIVMTFTHLGYWQIGPCMITFLCIPLAIGAVMEGPGVGMIVGLVFGLSSYTQAFGKDAICTVLNGQHPLYVFLMCVVPRVLTGLITGLAFKGLDKLPIKNTVAGGISCFICSITNTILFLVPYGLLLFYYNDLIAEFITKESLVPVLAGVLLANSLPEAAACTIIGTICITVLMRAYHRA